MLNTTYEEMERESKRILLTTPDLAKRWRVKPQTIRHAICKKIAPPYIKRGQSVRFDIKDIVKYEDSLKIDHVKLLDKE